MSDRFQPIKTGGNSVLCGITELTQDVLAGPGTGTQAATVVGLQTVPVDPTAPATGDVLEYDGSQWTHVPLTSLLPDPIFGQFSSDATQTVTNPAVAITLEYNTTDLANGVSITNNTLGRPTRITVSQAGIYEIAISPQIHKTSGTPATVTFWPIQMGTPVPASSSTCDVGGNLKTLLPFVSYMFSLTAGQYIEFAMASTVANTDIIAVGASAGPPVTPAAPSVIINVKRLGAIP